MLKNANLMILFNASHLTKKVIFLVRFLDAAETGKKRKGLCCKHVRESSGRLLLALPNTNMKNIVSM